MFSTGLWEHKEGPVVIISHYQCCGKDTGLRNVAQDKCGPEWRPQRDDPEFVSKPKAMPRAQAKLCQSICELIAFDPEWELDC